MSTRGIIARPDREHGWVGRYHHWSGAPTGLGAALWSALHGHFGGDADAMLLVLLDAHPAGWSDIVDADWSQPVGYRIPGGDDAQRGPRCYCHGERSDPPRPWVTPDADWGAEWCYIIDPDGHTLTVLEGIGETGAHAVGMFGANPGRGSWWEHGIYPLDGPEPTWDDMEQEQ